MSIVKKKLHLRFEAGSQLHCVASRSPQCNENVRIDSDPIFAFLCVVFLCLVTKNHECPTQRNTCALASYCEPAFRVFSTGLCREAMHLQCFNVTTFTQLAQDCYIGSLLALHGSTMHVGALPSLSYFDSPSSLDQAKGELLATVLQKMDSQLYIHTFSCRAEFWEKFKVTDLMAGICKLWVSSTVLHINSVTQARSMQIFNWSGTKNVAHCYWRTLLKFPTLCIVSGIHTEQATPISVPSTTVMQY